jgi:hypothetical protein
VISAVNGQRFYTNNKWPNAVVLKIENAKFEFNVSDIEIGKYKFYKIKIEGYNKSNNKLVLTQIYYNCFINEYLFGALINYNDENEGKMLEENFMNSFEK